MDLEAKAGEGRSPESSRKMGEDGRLLRPDVDLRLLVLLTYLRAVPLLFQGFHAVAQHTIVTRPDLKFIVP